MSNRKQPPFSVVPRAAARTLMREIQDNAATAHFGQEAGVPGMGRAPALQHQPGGRVVQDLLHPSFSIFEQLYRVLPEEGWFSPLVSPTTPVQFQLGAFEVPRNQALWLTDYEFSVYRPSGVDPGDFVQAAQGRFSNVLGFDITISGQRDANLSYQLDPVPVVLQRQEFEAPIGNPRSPAAFNRAAANSFASTAGPGTSLLPVRRQTQGPEGGPFTFVVGEGSQVALNCVIFNTVPSPLSAIQGRHAGYLLHQNVSEALLNRIRPR